MLASCIPLFADFDKFIKVGNLVYLGSLSVDSPLFPPHAKPV